MADAPTLQKTTLHKPWLVKMLIFLAVLVIFGCWGLLDALVIYPARGYEDASYKQRLYLDAAQSANRLSDASIPDPKARHAVLAAKRAELDAALSRAAALQAEAAGTTARAQQAAADLRRLQPDIADALALRWLDSLDRVSGLDPARTTMKDPAADLARLNERWKTAVQPKPLDLFDLPMQWAFAALGLGGAVYMLLFVLLPAKRTVFTFDPDARRLTLPSGQSLAPADIAEFDKRKWDKFFVSLRLKDGSTVKLDLLRHAKLEDWILDMERAANPDAAADAAPQPAPPQTAPPAQTPA